MKEIHQIKGAIYHLLDGTLDEECGDNIENLLSYLKFPTKFDDFTNANYNIANNKITETISNINFITVKKLKGQIEVNDSLSSNKIYIDMNTDISIFYENAFKYIPLNVFNIYQNSSNSHATSLFIHNTPFKLFVYSFNSGIGIDLHDIKKKLYSPYIKYSLDIKYIQFIILLGRFYNFIENYCSESKLFIDFFLKYIIDNIDYGLDYDNIFEYTDPYNPNKVVNDKIQKNEIIKKQLREYYIKELKYPIIIKIKISYYELLQKTLEILGQKEKLDTHTSYIEPPNAYINEDNITYNSIDNSIYQKIIFHEIENILYIYPQQSGSCSWFSIYWPLYYYTLIKDKDISESESKSEIIDLLKNPSFFLSILYKTVYNFRNIFKKLIFNYSENYIIINNIINKALHFKLINNTDYNTYYNTIYNLDTISIKIDDYNFSSYIDNELNYYNDFKFEKTNVIEIIKYIKFLDIRFLDIRFHESKLIYLFFYDNFEKMFNINFNMADINPIIDKLIPELFSIGNDKSERLNKQKYLLNIYKNNLYRKSQEFSQNKVPNYLLKYLDYSKNLIYFYDKSDKSDTDTLTKNIIKLSCMFYYLTNFAYLFLNNGDTSDDHKKCIKDIIKLLLLHNPLLYNPDQLTVNSFIYEQNINQLIINDDKYYNIFSVYNKFNLHTNYYIDFEIINKTNQYYFDNINFIINYLKFTEINIFEFIKLNLINLKYENKNKYITYFCKLYYDNPNYQTTMILNIINLLVNIIPSTNNYYYYNNDNYKNNDQIFVKNVLDNLKKKYNLFSEYIDYILNHLYIFNKKNYIEYLIKKYFVEYTITEDNIEITNEKQKLNYKICKIKTLIINDFFNITDSKSIQIISKEFIDTNYKNLYIINNDIIIKIMLVYSDITSENNKIHKIYINNNETYKYNEIDFPFKYIIPKSIFHLIYKENNIYKIIYFHDTNTKSNNGTSDMLKKPKPEEIMDRVSIISINPNNMYFPNEIDLFKKLCTRYGINIYNIIFFNNANENYPYVLTQYEYENISHSNKKEIFSSLIQPINIENLKLISDIEPNISQKLQDFSINQHLKTESDIITSNIDKLNKKIKECALTDSTKLKEILQKLIDTYKTYITDFTSLFDSKDLFVFNDLLEILSTEYQKLYNYLLAIKIINIINKFLAELELHKDSPNIDYLCGLLKTYNDRFNTKKYKYKYRFEGFFEFVSGFELSEEQMDKYLEITKIQEKILIVDETPEYLFKDSTFKLSNPIQQTAGARSSILTNTVTPEKIEIDQYLLYHFMMGKGKSTIISPIVTLYFTLIHSKHVYVIMPSHLKLDTLKIFSKFTDIFGIKDKLHIMTDFEIKALFLFHNKPKKDELNIESIISDKKIITNSVMLIDEFDTILDPLKSNFNIINEEISNPYVLNKFVKIILEIFLEKTVGEPMAVPMAVSVEESVKESVEVDKSVEFTEQTKEIINKNIDNIIQQINTNKLIENINWGIDSEKGYAIPYLNKDTPLANSSFSSIIMTIYLTLHYYLNLYYKDVNGLEYLCDKLYNYIIKNNILTKVFSIETSITINKEDINSILGTGDDRFKKILSIITYIINNIQLSSKQLNTSFVDILKIDNILKIGYSGTFNINLPDDESIKIKIEKDYDEPVNVTYAIQQATTRILNSNINNDDIINANLSNYDVIIDISGFFKNIKNEEIAKKIHEITKKTVIFMDENNIKLVIINNDTIESYNEFKLYENIFIYYSQSHTIGVDINQDSYPRLKGLCIINNNTVYKEVAQGIFRLRKLNLGQSIDFIYINYNKTETLSLLNSDQLIEKLIENENRNKENQKIYLDFQTHKSKIRKSIKLETTTHTYEENIKYIIDIPNIDELSKEKLIEIFNQIFNNEELKTQSTKILSEDTNISENILKQYINIIFNNDNLHSIECKTEKKHDIELITQLNVLVNQKMLRSIKKVIYFLDFEKAIILSNSLLPDYLIEKYKNIEIYYLPNIFFYINNDVYLNTDFLFVLINSDSALLQILIIPKYMIMYFYDNHIIFDHNLVIYNKKILSEEFKKDINNTQLFKNLIIFRNTKKINEEIHIIMQLIIIQLVDINYIPEFLKKHINFFIKQLSFSSLSSSDSLDTKILSRSDHIYIELNRYDEVNTDEINLNKTEDITYFKTPLEILSSSEVQRKYLKYKNKYINYKKSLNNLHY
jgi:hypothetical protein